MSLPPLPAVADVHERLQTVFPEGTANRNYVTREIAAKTVFVMLYIGAVEGADRWLRPDQVTRMTDAQAALANDQNREAWLAESMRPAAGYIEGRWYAANTREPISAGTEVKDPERLSAKSQFVEAEPARTTTVRPKRRSSEFNSTEVPNVRTGRNHQAGLGQNRFKRIRAAGNPTGVRVESRADLHAV